MQRRGGSGAGEMGAEGGFIRFFEKKVKIMLAKAESLVYDVVASLT